MPQTNGVAENCVRRVKEGGGCAIVQSGFNPATFWPPASEHYCFSVNIALIDGDSCYNRRHKQGHFKGQQIPFGALCDFMPQPDTKVESIGPKTLPGVFIGYHIHPGGLWSNDYLVAELSSFRGNYNVAWSKVKVHRVREVVTNHTGKFSFPVARWRRTELLNYQEHGLPTDPDMPDLEKDSSDDEEPPPRPAGSSTDKADATLARGGAAADIVVPSPIPLPAPAEVIPSPGGLLSANTGVDTRGLGLETFGGRGGVRKSKNTTRPPNIPPELWQVIGKKRQKKGDRGVRTRTCRRQRCRSRRRHFHGAITIARWGCTRASTGC
jgi:hypothetical protein